MDAFPLIYCCVCISNLQLPTRDKLKTVVDQVKDFFEDVKDTFSMITSFDDDTTTKAPEKDTKAKTKSKWVLCLVAWTTSLECNWKRGFSFFKSLLSSFSWCRVTDGGISNFKTLPRTLFNYMLSSIFKFLMVWIFVVLMSGLKDDDTIEGNDLLELLCATWGSMSFRKQVSCCL